MRQAALNRMISSAALMLAAVLPLTAQDNVYAQHNLVSDRPGAVHQDTRLVNAWGIDRSPTSPWWVNANGTGFSIVYDSNGAPAPAANPIAVMIPAPGGGAAAPTGIVFNGTLDFQVANGRPGFFLFATEDGTIAGWNPAVNATTAVTKVTTPNAVYKGLAIGMMGGHNVLYAANFHAGTVDVFDANFQPVSLPSGAFTDNRIPVGFAPFNVQNVDGAIYVTFAMQNAEKHDDLAGPGNGYVDRFTPEGALTGRLEHGNWLNSPWAVVQAPGNFGKLSRRLLVGNFGSGQIAAFNPHSGEFQGMMMATDDHPLTIDGLWGLKFGNGAAAGPVNVLFFAAGPNGEGDGLFGTLAPAAPHEDDAERSAHSH